MLINFLRPIRFLNEIKGGVIMQANFISAGRLVDEEIYKQTETIINENILPSLFNIMPYILLVINKHGQIIYSNKTFLKLLNFPEQKINLGLRFGEVLKCTNANKLAGGCGTTESCGVCGALLAILECNQTQQPTTRECLLETRGQDGSVHHELEVHAAPVSTSNSEHILFSVRDISMEKRRLALEEIFFHDLLNTSSAAQGLLDVVVDQKFQEDNQELIQCASETMDVLVEEIKSYQDLFAAENGKLSIKNTLFPVRALVEDLVRMHLQNDSTSCPINYACPEELWVKSDPVLLRRVLNNMLKNAVEASEEETVNIEVLQKEEGVIFKVHNAQYIARDIQLQIFKRSFSTKDKGQGLGTYSMKLLGEKYLAGKISFTTAKKTGTTFSFSLPVHKNIAKNGR